MCCITFYRSGDHYEWNKVTSCIHNILSGQRWIEHYGEITIRNSRSDVCQCKITFVKVRHVKIFSSSMHKILEAEVCFSVRCCKARNLFV